MVLLPAGLLMGKAIMDGMARRGAQVARTSAIADTTMHRQKRSSHLGQRRIKGNTPFERGEVLSRLGGRSVRLSSQQAQREKQLLDEALVNENWVAVYRYPGIRFAVLLARAKLVQTVASVLYLPYSSYCFMAGTASPEWFALSAGMAIAAPLLLAIFSRYLNRLVGVVAVSESNDWVRVGYLSFWGARRNKFLPVDEVMPLSEMGIVSGKGDSLVKWQSYADSHYLFLSTRNAEIVDEDRARLVFGDDLSVFDGAKKAF